MSNPGKFFHDRIVLLLLAINSALLITGVLFVLFHLDSSKGSAYILQCRYCDTAAHEFVSGKAVDMAGFILFMAATAVMSLIISRRVYHHRRYLALTVLSLNTLLTVFSIIVSYSLFSLR